MELSNKAAYIKGLMEGMNAHVVDSSQKKIFRRRFFICLLPHDFFMIVQTT